MEESSCFLAVLIEFLGLPVFLVELAAGRREGGREGGRVGGEVTCLW